MLVIWPFNTSRSSNQLSSHHDALCMIKFKTRELATPTVWRASSVVGIFPEDCFRKRRHSHHHASGSNRLRGSTDRCSSENTTPDDIEPVDGGGFRCRMLGSGPVF